MQPSGHLYLDTRNRNTERTVLTSFRDSVADAVRRKTVAEEIGRETISLGEVRSESLSEDSYNRREEEVREPGRTGPIDDDLIDSDSFNIDHNLDKSMVFSTVIGLSLSEEIQRDVIETLEKSLVKVKPEPEKFLEHIKGLFLSHQSSMFSFVGAGIGLWAHLRIRQKNKWFGMTSTEWEECQLLFRELWRLRIGYGLPRFMVPDFLSREWKKAGIDDEKTGYGTKLDLDVAFSIGTHGEVDPDTEFREVDYIDPSEETRVGQLFQDATVQRALEGLMAWGSGRSSEFARRLLQRQLTGAFNFLEAETPLGGPSFSQEEIKTLGRNGMSSMWDNLGSLAEEVFHDDIDHLNLIFSSEIRNIYHTSLLLALNRQGYEKVAFILEPDACFDCKRLLLGKEFTIRQIIENISKTGGFQPKGPRSNWLVLPLIHPNCRCRIIAVQ